MDNSKSSKIISVISVVVSVITLFFSYIKPQWIDKSKVNFFPSKYVAITLFLGDIQIRKNFGVTNTGKQGALVNKIDCFLIPEKTLSVYRFDDPFYVSNPDFITNDRQTRYNLLNGFTVWPSNGYEVELYYLQHHDQNYQKNFQDIRDSAAAELTRYRSRSKSTWMHGTESFTLSHTVKNKVVESQMPLYEIISVGTYLLCERLQISEGYNLYQVYSFSISNADFESLKKFSAEVGSQNDVRISQTINADLKLASQEDRKRAIKSVEEFSEKFK